MNTQRLVLILSVCLAIAASSYAQTYNPKADFSPTKNPNGVWTFGWSVGLEGGLQVYKDPFKTSAGDNWGNAAIQQVNCPHVGLTSHDVGNLPAGTMCMHPGPQRQFSHCIFKAPSAGLYDINATFTAISVGGPRVYVMRNGLEIGSSNLKQDKPWAFSSESLDMDAGDTLEVVVGVGSDKVFFNDETIFSLTITKH